MVNSITAEEFYSNYLKTLNPFSETLGRFEYYRVKILISRKLEQERNKLYLYLLDVYIDIKIGKKEVSPFHTRILKQYSDEGIGLASFLVYYCHKNKVTPFNSKEYFKYIYKAVENKYPLAYVEILHEHIISNIKLQQKEIDNYIKSIEDNKIKEIYNLYFQLTEDNYENNREIVSKLEKYSKYNCLIIFLILGKIYDEGKYISQDISKAIEYYKLAAFYKDEYSISRLAEIYISGLVPININLALSYYKQSIELKSDNILKYISLKVETKDIKQEEVELIVQSLKKINSDEANILLAKVYLEYPFLRKEKEGLYLLNYYALTCPSLYYDLYLYYTRKSNRKEAVRYLRRGIVKKDKQCIEEAKGYKKLSDIIH